MTADAPCSATPTSKRVDTFSVMDLRLTRSGRRNSVFFYGVSPSNPLAFQAAARVRQSHVSSLAKSLAKFHRAKQAQSAINRPSGQCHAVEALQLAHRKNVLGLD